MKYQLKKLSGEYRSKKGEFNTRQEDLICSFKLNKTESKELCFGLLVPANRSLKSYVDILNSDPELNRTSEVFRNIYSAGSSHIIKAIQKEDITIPGYDLD